MKSALPILLLSLCTASGCLTVNEKQYTIKLTRGDAGEATIRFIDIRSAADDSVDVTQEDFRHLLDFYLYGTAIEEENPGLRNVRKRLLEENGVLVGELSFEFDSLSTVRLFRYDATSPYMYYVGQEMFSEEVVETNGTLGGEQMPVLFWSSRAREFNIRTRIRSEAPYVRSLLFLFRQWDGEEHPSNRNRGQ